MGTTNFDAVSVSGTVTAAKSSVTTMTGITTLTATTATITTIKGVTTLTATTATLTTVNGGTGKFSTSASALKLMTKGGTVPYFKVGSTTTSATGQKILAAAVTGLTAAPSFVIAACAKTFGASTPAVAVMAKAQGTSGSIVIRTRSQGAATNLSIARAATVNWMVVKF